MSSCFLCSCSFSVLSWKAIFTPHKCFLLGWVKVKVVKALRTKCHSTKRTQHVNIMLLFRTNICVKACFLDTPALTPFMLSLAGRHLSPAAGEDSCGSLPDRRTGGKGTGSSSLRRAFRLRLFLVSYLVCCVPQHPLTGVRSLQSQRSLFQLLLFLLGLRSLACWCSAGLLAQLRDC